ncbi:MAG: TonB-dependent receptor [Rhizomicrobium sp.]
MPNFCNAIRAVSVLSAVLLCATGSAFAQADGGAAPTKPASTSEASTGSQLETVVVTAEKTGEDLQRVPVNVSAASAATLEEKGVTNIGDIQAAIPSLNTVNTLGYLTFFLHGVGTIQNGIGFENPVALYVDGVYIGDQGVGLFQFNNIAQVEVDKGPQGTLFGRNATGGVIQITTLEPTEDFHIKASLGVSSYGGVNGSLYAAGGIAPDLVADISIAASRRDGWGKNLFNGQEVYAVPHDVAVRSKWVYTPGDWKFTLIADYANTLNSNNSASVVQGSRVGNGVGPIGSPIFYPNPWDTDANVQPRETVEGGGVSLKAERSFGTVQMSNLASWRTNTFRSIADYDATATAGTGLDIHSRAWQFSDDLQFASSGDGPFKWVAGLYYFRANGRFLPDGVSIGGVVTPTGQTIPFFTAAIFGQENTQAEAVFAQGSYEILPALTLTLGARYSLEQRDTSGFEDAVNCSLPPGFCPPPVLVPPVSASRDFNQPTFKGALAYQLTPDTLVYTSVNTGFKSGGYNATDPASAFWLYLPEKIIAYEAGVKSDLLDRKLRVNASGFYYDYKHIQSEISGTTSTDINNAGSAHIYGLDADITAFPAGDLQLDASLSLLHAEYYEFPTAALGQPGGGYPVLTGNGAGNTLPHSPSVTLTADAQYPFEFANGTLTLGGNVYYNSGYYLESDNIIHQNAYAMEGATIRWTNDGHFSLLVYANNISNEAVKSIGVTIPTGNQWNVLGAPQTFGATLTYAY